MTSAGRPTFDTARGGQGSGEKDLSALSRHYSSRDLPGHTKLKHRCQGQGTAEELRSKDFRKELNDREKKGSKTSNAGRQVEPAAKRPKIHQAAAAILDTDDPFSSDCDDSDDDDTAALLAELDKIKKERAIEQAKKEAERRQEEERIRIANVESGNPLLNYSRAGKKNNLKVKRRWNEDVIFKNCARSESKITSNTFINDSLRSKFHKKFMEKCVK